MEMFSEQSEQLFAVQIVQNLFMGHRVSVTVVESSTAPTLPAFFSYCQSTPTTNFPPSLCQYLFFCPSNEYFLQSSASCCVLIPSNAYIYFLIHNRIFSSTFETLLAYNKHNVF